MEVIDCISRPFAVSSEISSVLQKFDDYNGEKRTEREKEKDKERNERKRSKIDEEKERESDGNR